MEKEVTKQLNSALRVERLKKLAKYGVAALVLFLVAGYNVPVRFEFLNGVTEARNVYHTDIGEVHRVSVVLMDGEVITASLSPEMSFKADHPVELQLGSTLFAIEEYRIIRYLDNE